MRLLKKMMELSEKKIINKIKGAKTDLNCLRWLSSNTLYRYTHAHVLIISWMLSWESGWDRQAGKHLAEGQSQNQENGWPTSIQFSESYFAFVFSLSLVSLSIQLINYYLLSP